MVITALSTSVTSFRLTSPTHLVNSTITAKCIIWAVLAIRFCMWNETEVVHIDQINLKWWGTKCPTSTTIQNVKPYQIEFRCNANTLYIASLFLFHDLLQSADVSEIFFAVATLLHMHWPIWKSVHFASRTSQFVWRLGIWYRYSIDHSILLVWTCSQYIIIKINKSIQFWLCAPHNTCHTNCNR